MNQRQFQLIVALVVTLILGAAFGYWFAQQRSWDERADAQVTPAQSGRKVLYWHDPMVPNAKFDKPGKSPFMDMDLVPVYADEQGGAQVNVSPAVSQNLGIRLGTV